MGIFDRWRPDPAPKGSPPVSFILEHTKWRIPVKVVVEPRSNSRVAFGKQGVIIRISSYANQATQRTQVEEFKGWIIRQLEGNPHKYTRFEPKIYSHGQSIQVGDRVYSLILIPETGRSSVTGKLDPSNMTIRFFVPAHESEVRLGPVIESLLSRLIGAHHLPEIIGRVNFLNQKFIGKPIKGVKLKYNHSNWGSCSTKGNINLSSKLLFAPSAVLDYVIIHELAHLVEMNHSPRFWAIVAKAMPDYKRHERWLKEEGPGLSY